jgi:choline-sulfatase
MRLRLLYGVLGILLLSCRPPKAPQTFQNVLFIISDDLATHAVGCYGNDLIQTPNLDAMAAEGTLFERAYANAPMCTPSRATLITGLYPHKAGVTLLRTPLPDSVLTIAEYLKDHGFATGIFGKNHFNSGLKHGFDTLVNNREHRQYLTTVDQDSLPEGLKVRPQWKPFRDPARIWLNAEGASSGNYLPHSQGTFFARSGIDFIKKHRNGRFFAVVSFREPHSPFNFPVEFADRYDPRHISLPQASEEDERWVPAVFQDLNPEEKRGITRSYYNSVSYMDQNVGMVLDSLAAFGLQENTLVVFVGDHGYLLNHHGRFEKHMMWEEAVTTPLLIRGYGVGQRISQPVELVDLVPTMVQGLGLQAMPARQGVPLQALMAGEDPDYRPFVISQYLTDNKTMITDGRYKYIYTSCKRDLGSGYATGKGPSGERHRLYDLQTDPRESTDLAHDPAYEEPLLKLKEKLVEHFRTTHPFAREVPGTLSWDEQLRLFCEPPEGENPGSF